VTTDGAESRVEDFPVDDLEHRLVQVDGVGILGEVVLLP
jgi:hypothetical protein